jgi:hypothetical protein
VKQELIDLAKRHVDKIRNRDASFEKEQKDLEKRIYEIKSKRDEFKKKLLRSVEYDANSGVCPICFIDNGLSVEFKPMPGDVHFHYA